MRDGFRGYGRVERERGEGGYKGEKRRMERIKGEGRRRMGGNEGQRESETRGSLLMCFPLQSGHQGGWWIQSWPRCLKGLTGLLNAPTAPMPPSMMGLMLA